MNALVGKIRLAVILGFPVLAQLCCAPGGTELKSTESAGENASWIDLSPGSGSVSRWRALQGKITCKDGVMTLHGRDRDASIVAEGVNLGNGTLEVKVSRGPDRADAGPCTVAVRLLVGINWRGLYFVCRPGSIEACRASSSCWFPPPEQRARFARIPGPELWRFTLNGAEVQCYRCGKNVLSYVDPNPCSGTIGLTASRCQIEVLGIRYRPAQGPPPAGGPGGQSPTRRLNARESGRSSERPEAPGSGLPARPMSLRLDNRDDQPSRHEYPVAAAKPSPNSIAHCVTRR